MEIKKCVFFYTAIMCILLNQYASGFDSVNYKKVLGIGFIRNMEAFNNNQIYIISNNGIYILDAAIGRLINHYTKGYDPSMGYALSPNGKWFLSYSPSIPQKFSLLDSYNGNMYADLSDFEIPLYPFSKLGDALLLKKDAGLYEYRIEDKRMSLIKADFFNERSRWRFTQFVDSEKK